MHGRTHETDTHRGAHAPGDTRRPAGGSLRGTAPFLDQLRSELGEQAYERYIGNDAEFRLDDDGLHVAVRSRFAADMIDSRFGPAIRRALDACGYPADRDVCIGISPADAHRGTRQEPPAPPRPASSPGRPRRHRPARTATHALDTFVVGQCNRLAFETARRIAESSDPTSLGPCFLYGPCGVGKSHLLNAVARQYKQIHPGARVKVVTAESFTNEYVAAVRSNTIEAFHRAYRRIDLLCIDDVHYLARKTGTQNELLHTFDALDLGGAPVVLASDAHPRQIKQLSEALVSRFVSGLLARIDPPDRLTARRLVEHFAKNVGLALEPEAVRVLAESASPASAGEHASARDLLGVVNHVLAYVRLASRDPARPVDAALAISAIHKHTAVAPTSPQLMFRPVPIDHIVQTVCSTLEVTRQDLAGKGRHKHVVLARAMISLLAKRLTKRSYPEIAAAIGRSNHSTVITAHRRIEGQIERGETVDAGLHLDGTPLAVLADRLEHALRAAR
ncbi:MAG: AAA family ATPase [Phycisphaeraceae bacterium]|nr:MAG: AAA family ATPase [Phycisphaeraceae bacterium]